jgi:ADP-dependent phosphofructokinase/glucokinase
LHFIICNYGPASLLDLNGKRSISHIFELSKKNWEIFEDKTINGPNIEKYELKLLPSDLQVMFLKVNKCMLDEYWKENRLKIIKKLISYNKIK